MSFKKDFNTVLNDVLTAYRNMGPVSYLDMTRLKQERPDIYNEYLVQGPPDVSVGSLLYIDAAVLASMVWGLYSEIHKASMQIVPSTSNVSYLTKHAAEFSINTSGKSKTDILNELLLRLRRKSAGGNKYDYIEWAKEVTVENEYVKDVTVMPLAQGEGTFDVIIVGSNDIPSPELCAAVESHINDKRPICSGFSWGMRILPPIIKPVVISLSGTGDKWNKTATQNAIVAYMQSLRPLQILPLSQITAIAHQHGAESAHVNQPESDVEPISNPTMGLYEMIRPVGVFVT